jgi:hypothetical protein
MISELRSSLIAGLRRKASKTCSRWAQNYVVLGKPLPGPLRFANHPWSMEMMDYDKDWVGKKAAQMAYSLTAIVRALYTVDVRRNDVLYVLPKWSPDASDFSKAKFDPILESSPYINEMFSNVRNVGHKQAGNTNFFLRGARSKSGLKAISTALKVFDEYDEMPKWAGVLGEERSSGYLEQDKQTIKLSTPTIPDYGIDAEFKLSTQENFIFRCPACSRYTELTFPECLVITADGVDDPRLKESFIQCKLCQNQLSHKSKPEWLKHRLLGGTAHFNPTAKADVRGFYVNQLYSIIEPWRIALSALRAPYSEVDEQELFNSKLGLAHATAGSRVTLEAINRCIGNHDNGLVLTDRALVTMGVDIGKRIHVQINQWFLPEIIGKDLNTYARARVLLATAVNDFEELDQLMVDYQVVMAVVDMNPETRKTNEFTARFEGNAYGCYFVRGDRGREIAVRDTERRIDVHRASWLDVSQRRFLKGWITLPKDISDEYKEHIRSLARIQKKNDDGEVITKYISTSPTGASTSSDHYAFANVYAEIALILAVSQGENRDITELI